MRVFFMSIGGSEANMSVTIVYNKYDAVRLCGVVGTDRAGEMLTSHKTRHMFSPGDSLH